MGQLDESDIAKIAVLSDRVQTLINKAPAYEQKIDKLNSSVDDIRLHLAAHDLPEMKRKIDKMEKNKWIMVGAAGTAGAAGGGFLPWLKATIAHLLL